MLGPEVTHLNDWDSPKYSTRMKEKVHDQVIGEKKLRKNDGYRKNPTAI